MSWTQGVEGLNLKKKASRKRRNMDLANKEKSLEEEQTYIIPDQIPSYQEVVIQSQP